MNIRLENTTFAQFNVMSSINHAHFWSTIQIQIQIILLVEQIQIQIMTSLHTANVYHILSTAEADGNVISLEVFGRKAKYWTKCNLDLMTALNGQSGDKSYYSSSSGDHKCL